MKSLRLLLVPALVFLSGCDMIQEFPMHNPQSGERISCLTWRELWGMTGPERRALDVCIRACEAKGFVGEKDSTPDGDRARKTVMVNSETESPECPPKGL